MHLSRPKESIVPVICPGCATRYVLPSQLLGPSGARICCPACGLTFVLLPDGELTAVLGRPESANSTGRPGGPATAAAADIAPPSLERAEPPLGASPGASPANGTEATHTTHAARALALDVLHALDDPPGGFALAAAEARLFADHGRVLIGAYEALVLESVGEVTAAVFREALFDVAGLDLQGAAADPDDATRQAWHTNAQARS